MKAARGGNFSRDGKGVYFTSDLGSEFRTLRYADLATGKVTPLTDHLKWDVDSFVLSRDGRYLAYVVNEDGASRLGVMDLVQHADLIPPQLPFGVIGSMDFDPAGKRLAFSLQTPAQPNDAWVWTLADGKLERWTAERDRAGRREVAASRRRSCASPPSTGRTASRAQIPAWVYKPAGAGPHPVLISIHGGPEAQSQPVFSTQPQQWAVELGYAVILAERARLVRLRQDLPRARQRHEARGLGQGHRRAARLDRARSRTSTRSAWS